MAVRGMAVGAVLVTFTESVTAVFQRFELNDAFSFTNRMQQHRQCKESEVAPENWSS